MRLKALKLRNFRGYQNETRIEFNSLTAFVGKNDAGKSTILEALEIFFNNSIVKIERGDLNVDALAGGDKIVEITCIFTSLPTQLIIDADHPTTLAVEHLLNADGELEIQKVYNCAPTKVGEQVFIVADHPTVENGNDLLQLKRTELRTRATQLGIQAGTFNANINSEIRQAIWNSLGNLVLQVVKIQVDKEDSRKAWEYVEHWLPQYALFKSDRESNDSDKEVTDPMKVAINSAIAEVAEELADIQHKVMEKAIDVAERTLAKLQEMNPDLANELRPDFKTDPKWNSLFGLTLSSDRNIPINKRGSGVRRLIVLNFFRAEAERRRNENNSHAIIYAFEEPENSQHPDHQAMLVKAFRELADSNNTQVILTTHNPALAGLIEEQDLRLIKVDDTQQITVQSNHPAILRDIAKTLGMLPEPLQPRLLVCVEGPNDVIFFKNISRMINQQRNDLPDLSNDTRVAIFPLGGSTLKDWVNYDYLQSLNKKQYHIYDLDDQANPPYQAQVNKVCGRGNGDWAVLTAKREIENYLHPGCIQAVYGFNIAFTDMDDVPAIVAENQHAASASPVAWEGLDEDIKRKKISHAKKRLNHEVSAIMNWGHIQQSDTNSDIISWLEQIRDRIEA